MESFPSFFDLQSQSSSRSSSWTHDILKNFRQISPVVQTHLIQVYILLCCALIALAIGVYHHIIWNIGGFLTFFASLICMYLLLTTPSHEETKRVSLLMAFSLLHGAALCPIIELGIDVDPSILVKLYFGILVFVGYIVVDTHEIIERAHLGDLDYVSDSLLLFANFMCVFFRIVEIIAKEKEKEAKKKKRE